MLEPITRRHKMCASFVLVCFKFEYGTHFGEHLLLMITHILGKVINQRLWIAKNIRVLLWNWKRWEDFWSMRRMVTFRYKHLFEQNHWTHSYTSWYQRRHMRNESIYDFTASASASSRYYNEWLYILYILGNIKWNWIRIYFSLNLLKSIELHRKN